ncbi:MAG: HD domain-containing protein [Emergencia sp.]|jgi:uncharacterized protein|nr:HD domain-containing protein [Emergencia sp.]
MKKAQMIQKMIDFYEGSVHDVEHFLKVLSYAGMIGKLEGLDEKTQDILEMAAIVHDIACPLCREKYGNTDGKHQEIESEGLLRPFLFEFNLAEEVLERVIYLVSHHHTFSGIDGQDYQILVEADFLVNASEAQMSRAQIEAFKGKVAKTETGKGLLDSIYLR